MLGVPLTIPGSLSLFSGILLHSIWELLLELVRSRWGKKAGWLAWLLSHSPAVLWVRSPRVSELVVSKKGVMDSNRLKRIVRDRLTAESGSRQARDGMLWLRW